MCVCVCVVMNEVNFDPRFQMPFSCIVIGPSGCGKSVFVQTLLQNMEYVFSRIPDKIVWAYTSYQPLYDELSRQLDITFIEGIPDSFTDEDIFPPKQHNLIVIDDAMMEGSNSEELGKAFTQYRHHRNLSVIYLVQNLFNQGKHSRTISLNASYMVIFKNPRDKQQLNVLARQMFPGQTKFFLDCYEDATKEPHTYLLIDLRTECPDSFRLRTGILPSEWPTVYLSKKK